jgi:XTP/dITP diphosphohydrolase
VQPVPERLYKSEKGQTMKHKIIFATGNEGKMREARLILADLGFPVLSMKEAQASCDVEENGSTFAENAAIKARAVWEQTGDIVLADDSGLVVDYLGGEPGIYSARYMGEDTSYEIKNQAIIHRLAEAEEEGRTARFVCAIAAVLPDGTELSAEGTVEGLIAHEPAGDGGFGYDPIFYLPEYGMTSAQIPIEKKNEISHRGKALEAMKAKLKSLYGEEDR